MNQSGLRTAKNWCSATAEYHEIKRLAAFREELGQYCRWIIDWRCGFITVAETAVAGDEAYGYAEADLFWKSVGATRHEVTSCEFLDGFLEGCELFWKAIAKDI